MTRNIYIDLITLVKKFAARQRRIAAASSHFGRALASALVSLLLLPATTLSQGSPNRQHTKNTADQTLRGDFKIDPVTLGMSITIPLGHYPGRAGTAMPLALHYNSKVWRVAFNNFINGNLQNCENNPDIEVGTECYTTTLAVYGENSVAGWTFSTLPTIEWGGERYNLDGRACCEGTEQGRYIPRLTVRFADGSAHELRKNDTPSAGGDPQAGDYFSVDSSRLKFVAMGPGAGRLHMPDGSFYDFTGGSATRYVDRNGNVLTNGQDTLGRQISAPTFHNGFAHTETRSLPGVGNTPMTYTFDLRELSGVLEPDSPQVRRVGDMDEFGDNTYSDTLFTSIPGSRVVNSETHNPVVLHRIVLPDGSAYTFTYNDYGEIARVVYPTGGYERYRYAEVAPLTQLSAPYVQANRGVVERRVSASGNAADEKTWLYPGPGESIEPESNGPGQGTHTVRSIHFGQPPGSILFGFDDPRAGRVYDERVFASQGGAMLRRVLTEWAMAGPTTPGGHPSARRDPKVMRTVEILLDTGAGNPLAKTTTYQYGQTSQPLNVTAVTEHAFVEVARATAEGGQIGDIPAGVALRTTETTYKEHPDYTARNMVGLPERVTVRAGEAGTGPVVARTETFYDETSYHGTDLSPLPCAATAGRGGSTPAARGNVTTVGRWLDTVGAVDNPSAYLDTHTQYDACGSPRKMWEAEARETLSARVSEVEYAASFQSAYPTQTRTAVPDPSGQRGSATPLETTSDYDFSTGLLVSTTDPNLRTTSYSYHDPDTGAPDPWSRLRKITRPDGGWTRYNYGTTPGNFIVRTQAALDASRATDSYQYVDGLGRPSRSFSFDGSAAERTWAVADTEYDNAGRVRRVSNPYFVQALGGTIDPSLLRWTTSEYDRLGRVMTVTTPDGAVLATAYEGEKVTGTDQAGRARRSVTDALGRLTSVTEAPEISPCRTDGAGCTTSYTYDVLDNLRVVTQGQQTRTFVYDSLSRLTSAVNPEGGTLSYSYDPSGNLTQKTDARGITTTYSYDGVDRVTVRNYSDATPDVTYTYDAVGVVNSRGRLTSVSSSVSTSAYTAYDVLGRVTGSSQATETGAGVQTYAMSYTYNLAGGLKSQTYPSGRVVETEYDAAARLAGVRNQATGLYYAGGAASDSTNRVEYAAHGAAAALRLGNGLWEHTLFNSRLQAEEIGLGTSRVDSSTLRLGYSYGTTNNNGNVLSHTITLPGLTLTQTYGYDPLNRLETARENDGASWKQRFVYDRYGNRRIDPSDTTPELVGPNPTISEANNRITSSGYGYDSAGNLTMEPASTGSSAYAYDAENRMTLFNGGASVNGGATYFYDGEGRRVKKVAGVITTVFVYDAVGQMVAEYSSEAAQANGIRYLTQDPLGSPRVVTDASSNVKARHDYHPFGEEVGWRGGRSDQNHYVSDNIRQKFTGKVRDNENGLDYFLARYYSSAMGRFTSPDEFTGGPDELYYFVDDASENPTFYADLRNPQSLNKYQYAYNSPLRYVDPDGHEPEPQIILPLPPPPVVAPPPAVPGAPPAPPPPTPGQIIDAFHENIIYPLTDLSPIRAVRDMLGTNPAPTDSDVPSPNVAPPQPVPVPQTGTPAQQQAQPKPPPPPAQAHKQKKQSTGRGRTKGKHQAGTARKARDRGGEKADPRRKGMPFHKKRPDKWKGPWPPKPKAS